MDSPGDQKAERKRVGVIAGAALALLAGGVLVATWSGREEGGIEAEGDPSRAPIILIDIDTLRADHLGTYGYARDTSPAIDAFASEAAVFEWTFAQGPNTPPSQASILTGLYPSRHGRITGGDVLRGSVQTLAEVLKAAGYTTAGFVDGGLMHSQFGMAQGFDLYRDRPGGEGEGRTRGARGVEGIGPEVDEWLAQNKDERFFLLVHTYDVHAPYARTPRRFRRAFLSQLRRPSAHFRKNSHAISQKRARWERRRVSDRPVSGERPSVTPIEMAWLVGLYDGGIRHVDHWFGRFTDRLRQLGIYERAIIVVISDHGEEFDEHDSMDHYAVYSPVARVPMIIRTPFQTRGLRLRTTVQTVDLVPTLLDLIGVEAPGSFDGRSLAPLLRGEELPPRLAFTESPFSGSQTAVAGANFRIVRTGRADSVELFAFRSDPLEQQDVAANHPDVRDRMRQAALRYDRRIRSLYAPADDRPLAEIDSDLEAGLRQLGYVE